VAVSAAAREIARILDSGEEPETICASDLFGTVAAEMVGTGRSRGHEDLDICSILIVTVIPTSPRRDGSRRIWTAQIGDVSLWRCRGDSLQQFTGVTKSGMDKNVLACVLPHDWEQATCTVLDVCAGDRIAVMTDGVSETLTNVRGGATYFTDCWSGPAPHPARFALSLCYDAPGQSDDRTVVVVWCGENKHDLGCLSSLVEP
jgi:hypothetical protein